MLRNLTPGPPRWRSPKNLRLSSPGHLPVVGLVALRENGRCQVASERLVMRGCLLKADQDNAV
jgi:hypothetical protein